MKLILRLAGAAGPEQSRTLDAGSGEGGTLSIGRGAENSWVLADPDRTLSKNHCRIDASEGGFMLTDLSTNGVFLSGSPHAVGRGHSVALENGDSFTMGPYRMLADISGGESDGLDLSGGIGLAPSVSPLVPQIEEPWLDNVPGGAFGPGRRAAPQGWDAPPDPATYAATGLFEQPGATAGALLPDDAFSAAPGLFSQQSEHIAAASTVMRLPEAQVTLPTDWMDGDPMEPSGSPAAAAAQPPAAAAVWPPVLPEAPPPPEPVAALPPEWAAPPPQPDTLLPNDWIASAAPLQAAPAQGGETLALAALNAATLPPPALPASPAPAVQATAPAALARPRPARAPAPPPAAYAPPARLPAARQAPPAPVSVAPAPIVQAPVTPPPAAPAPPVPVAAAPAPAGQVPAAAGVAEPERSAATDLGAVAAFLEGAGLPPETLAGLDAEAALREVGRMVRAAVEGVRDVMSTRALVKSEFRVEQTVLRRADNNQMKFAPDTQRCLAAMVGAAPPGFLPGAAAMQQSMDDIKMHELALVAALNSVFADMGQQLDPDAIMRRARLDTSFATMLPYAREAKCWALYVETFKVLVDSGAGNTGGSLLAPLAQAYALQTRRAR